MYYVPRQRRQRAGFTLVELLIIIAIITIVLALGASAYFVVSLSASNAATQHRIGTMQQLLKARWDKVVSDARKEAPSDACLFLAGGDQRRAQIIHIKARLAEAFPMSYAEIRTPFVHLQNFGGKGPLLPRRASFWETYNNALKNVRITPPGDPATESAACLYIALSVVKTANSADLGSMVKDTDNDNITELTDIWYQPVAFFRFPVESDNPVLQANAPQGGDRRAKQFRDPLDEEGLLLSPGWSPILRAEFEKYFHKVSADTPTTTNSVAYYTAPVIVSPGINGKLGLDLRTMAVTDPRAAEDNLYSLTIRLGGGTK